MPTTAPKHFVKGGDTKFYRYPREPECQWRWILPGMRHDWAPTEGRTDISVKTEFKPRVTLGRILSEQNLELLMGNFKPAQP